MSEEIAWIIPIVFILAVIAGAIWEEWQHRRRWDRSRYAPTTPATPFTGTAFHVADKTDYAAIRASNGMDGVMLVNLNHGSTTNERRDRIGAFSPPPDEPAHICAFEPSDHDIAASPAPDAAKEAFKRHLDAYRSRPPMGAWDLAEGPAVAGHRIESAP